MRLGIMECLVFLYRFQMLIVVALKIKRLVNQFGWIILWAELVGLDDQLPAIPVFCHRAFRDICRGNW